MSVINNMLKDLEQRQHAAKAEMPPPGVSGARRAGPARGMKMLFGLSALAVAASLAAGWYWNASPAKPQRQEGPPAPASMPTAGIEQPSPEAVKTPPITPKEPVRPPAVPDWRIEAVHTQAEPGALSIELVFDRALPAPPQPQRQGRRLYWRLFPAQAMPDALPTLPTGQHLISAWALDVADGFARLSVWQNAALDASIEPLGERRWRVWLRRGDAVQTSAVEAPSPAAERGTAASQQAVAAHESAPAPSFGTETAEAGEIARENRSPSGATRIEVKPRLTAESLVKKAQQAWQQQRLAEAEQLLMQAREREPGHLPAYRQLARLHLLQQRGEAAEAVALQGLEQAPADAELVTLFARALMAQARAEEALAFLQASQQADQADHWGLLAALHQRLQDHSRARQCFVQALAMRPGEHRWWVGLGVSLEHLGELGPARDAYVSALQQKDMSTQLKRFVQSRLDLLDGRS